MIVAMHRFIKKEYIPPKPTETSFRETDIWYKDRFSVFQCKSNEKAKIDIENFFLSQ